MGGNGFGPSMTYDQALASTCSTCKAPKDKSNYWTPTLYFRAENGSFISVDQIGGALIYYQQRVDRGKDETSLIPFPPGFRMVAGDASARNYTGTTSAKAVSHACLYNGKRETNGFPTENCPGGLRTQIYFPSCWNGKDIDSADHKSHMAYPSNYDSGDCPAGFRHRFISLFYEIIWNIDPFKDLWHGHSFPFVLSTGDPTGYGFHGDFVSGWKPEVLKDAIDHCLDGNHALDHIGAIEYCPPLLPLISDEEAKACTIPRLVDEEVSGTLDALPGCNPVQEGPRPATRPTDCRDTAQLKSAPKPVPKLARHVHKRNHKSFLQE
ncbi:MAG: hypothetical protein M1825_002673 [Sarcosagium campestre]|nr:MAG: hypothetical protein M1825_002673 [Sarcosagium campestre]